MKSCLTGYNFRMSSVKYSKEYKNLHCHNCYSADQLCLTLSNPMDCSIPGFPDLHHLPELVQTHVHGVGDAIQTSHPLLSPSPPAFNLSK